MIPMREIVACMYASALFQNGKKFPKFYFIFVYFCPFSILYYPFLKKLHHYPHALEFPLDDMKCTVAARFKTTDVGNVLTIN